MVYFVTNYEDYIESSFIKFVKPYQIEDLLLNSKIICEDTETIGLNAHVPNPLLLIQIGTEANQFVFDVRSGIDLTVVKKVLEDRKIVKVLANGIFERQMLRSVGIQLNSMFDVSLAAQVHRQGRELRKVLVNGELVFIYSLAGLFREYLKIDIDKEQQSTFIGHKDKHFSYEQIMYAAEDVKLYELYNEILRKLIKYELINEDYDLSLKVKEMVEKGTYYKAVLEFKVQEYFADMLYNGIYLDKEQWRKIYEYNKKAKFDTEVRLNKQLKEIDPTKKDWRIYPHIEEDIVQTDLFGNVIEQKGPKNKLKYQLNWGSSMQVLPIIEKAIGRRPTDKHGKETISNKELKKMKEANTSPFIKDLIEYSSLNKAINAYGLDYFENIDETTGRIHFQINQVLETGRIAPRDPNLAQIPSGKIWRDAFAAPKGWMMVGADYSAQESQTMADKSGDIAFIDFFLNGDGDSHSMVASRVFSAKEGRKVIVKKKSLSIEHKGELDGSLESTYRKYFPKANDITYDNEYMIMKSKEGAECPLRQQGKVLNFFISFGGSAYTLSLDSGITYQEADDLINSFWKGFPELKSYFDAEKEFALKNGYTLINKVTKGRRWHPTWKEYRSYELRKEEKMKELIKQHGEREGKRLYFKGMKERTLGLSEANSKSFKIKGDIERAAMNTGIQGTAADMTKTSCILLMEKLIEDGYGLIGDIKPVNCVHDENLLQVREGLEDYAQNVLKFCMEESSRIFSTKLIINAAPYAAREWKH